jgi:hypothetical protein
MESRGSTTWTGLLLREMFDICRFELDYEILNGTSAVMAILNIGDVVFVADADGNVRLYGDDGQFLSALEVRERGAVFALCEFGGDVFSGCQDGTICRLIRVVSRLRACLFMSLGTIRAALCGHVHEPSHLTCCRDGGGVRRGPRWLHGRRRCRLQHTHSVDELVDGAPARGNGTGAWRRCGAVQRLEGRHSARVGHKDLVLSPLPQQLRRRGTGRRLGGGGSALVRRQPNPLML